MAEARKATSILIINKFGPDSNAITGKTSKDLGDYLIKQGLDVRYLCIDSVYKGKNESITGFAEQSIYKLKPSKEPKTPIGRFVGSLWDGFRLYWSSVFKKTDIVVIMTDPPLLIFWFQLFRFSKRRIIYWAMDVYPEAFSAGGYISSSNLIYKFISYIVYRKKPDLIISLGSEQKKFLQERFSGEKNAEIFPCGIVDVDIDKKNSENNNHKIRFGYGGNIGEAHDAKFLIELINNLDPEKHEIIVSLYGSKASLVLKEVKNSSAITIRKTLTLADIASVDINVASLLPQWNHICVPSKAVTAICCSSALLLNVTKDSDAFHMFKTASWIIEPQEDYLTSVQHFLKTLTKEKIQEKKREAEKLGNELRNDKIDVFNKISNFIMFN